jgi:hypothetical protein
VIAIALRRLGVVNQKAFVSGLFFAAIGLFAAIHATDYAIGRVTRMGPGFFPLMLGLILLALGLTNMVCSIAWAKPEGLPKLALKPLAIVPVALASFGFLLDRTGLLVAVCALVTIASLGDRSFRKREIVAVCLAVCAIASLLYVYGLGLPAEVLLPRWR